MDAISHTRSDKAIRLLDYLLRLTSLRGKMIRDMAGYEQVFWISTIPHDQSCFTQAWGCDEEHESDEWLEVQNQQEPQLPAVPAQCKDWIDPAVLRSKNDLPELSSEIICQFPNPDWHKGSDEPETLPRTEHLEKHPEVQQAWNCYVEDKWLPWTDHHNAWGEVHEVYSKQFAIHQEQLRLGEEYELVLGLGLLTWETPDGQRVRRHLIVADAILEFEAGLGKFTVRPHTEGAKLRPELDMLDIGEQPARAEETAAASLATAEDDPWEKGCVEGVLRALVHSFSSHGNYDGSLEATSARTSSNPTVQYAPALILRKRSAKGLTEALRRIKEQIENGGDIPAEFADLAEIRPKNEYEPADIPEESAAVFDGEIFFPKPSNDEQRRIVDKIRASNGVLVQGPPGTGKSHTIANLICHLLATGQRTLITAKTPRALRVLEGLIPDELRPLCINLLGSGLEERRSLESSVTGILHKNEEWNEDQTRTKQGELEQRLRERREEKVEINRRLRQIRESETHTQSIANGAYRGTAARIAEVVNRDRADYEWFTDSAPLDQTCPICADDLMRILPDLRQFTPEKCQELDFVWPEALPSPDYFADLVKKEAIAAEEEGHWLQRGDEQFADLLRRSSHAFIDEICNVFSIFRDIYEKLRAMQHAWMSEALCDIAGGNGALWHELLRITREVIASTEELVAAADEVRIEFPDTTDIRSLYEDARTLEKHMESGGTLGWRIWRPEPVKQRLYVLKTVKVDGRLCSTINHFRTLAHALHVRIACEKAWKFWKGRSDKTQGPYTLQLAALKSLSDALESALKLEGCISECREAINQCSGIGEPVWTETSQIERIISSSRLALARFHKQVAAEKIGNVEFLVSGTTAKAHAHPGVRDLQAAIRNRDVDKFTRCANTKQNLEKQRQRLKEVDEVLSKIRSSLPLMVKSLEQTCNEPYWEERLHHIRDAWNWTQAQYWIDEYIRNEDVPALGSRVKQIEADINGILAKLASIHAWSFCFSRLNEEHRRHMQAWQQSVQRIGKGTGKHAPRHRREAQAHLNECREAVPAWVMPLHRVWDTVNPSPGMFDVVIVDEASQCGVESLPLFYLAKKILIVGDDKQISPDAVGMPRDSVRRLMEEFLYDFQFKSAFDVESSLFDHGKLRYGTRHVTLREHFRCMPEIIRFSNDLSYSDTPLIPLRQYGPNRLPPLDHIPVTNGYREGSNNRTINRPEAEKIVEKIAEMCNDSRYDHKTMGVVVLQGEAQAALIEYRLLEQLGAEEMERRRLICGNPYSFQGDERDIIFLSLVAATNQRIGALTKASDERRFNVAASRARDMMILFHSVTCDDLSVSCLRRRLLHFFENTDPQQIAGIERNELERRAVQDNRGVVKPPASFESWFEVDVALELLRRNYTVLAQYEVAGKRIDLVVEFGGSRLAVECDGDNWHGADQYEADMQRQRQLERCGWEFYRVRESAFYANTENALDGLWQALKEREILPESPHLERSSHSEMADNASDNSDFDAADDDDTQEDSLLFADIEGRSVVSGRSPDEVTAAEIQDAIVQALSNCPNQSCTLDSLTKRVLKGIGIRTRGNPRINFEKRVMRSVTVLEARNVVEQYRANNKRIRLEKSGM